MDAKILERAGLTEGEVKVYLTLLELGSSLAGIIIKKSALQSSTIYHCLDKLIEKGLVSYIIKANRKYYKATNPERLLDYISERQERLEEEKAEVRKILPELLGLRRISGKPLNVNVYQGYKGLKSVFENMLKDLTPNGEYLDFGVSGLFRKVMPFYWDTWQRRKRKIGIRSKCIFDESLRRNEPKLLRDYVGKARFYSEKYHSAVDTFIYKDNVVLFIWTAKPPFAILISNKDVASSYRNQFRMLWKAAKL